MNSFTGSKSNLSSSSSSSTTVSFDSYQFDFGFQSKSSSSSRPLKDQKLNPNAAPSKSHFSSTPAAPSPATRPSWTHQPANPSPSMAGDIFGRNWSSSSSSKIGIQDKNPNLFGDLVGSVIGQGRSSQNVPLKSAPVKNSNFSMADLKSSVPNSNNARSNSTGAPMKPASGGAASNAKADIFGSLMGFQSKSSSNAPLFAGKSSVNDYSLDGLQNAKRNDFGASKPAGGGADPLNVLFSSPSITSVGASLETKVIPEMNDWDFGSESGGTTTELEGLPPPPVGVTASAAKVKGLDSYKQGQYADAIKWLSWAVVLLEKGGNFASLTEVLICRGSCYKEVGEYKKAIADCSKVLEHDSSNVSVLLQRALLYESSEKYRLGAEDLRAVLKIDPSNRLAKSTIHRMTQFAD